MHTYTCIHYTYCKMYGAYTYTYIDIVYICFMIIGVYMYVYIYIHNTHTCVGGRRVEARRLRLLPLSRGLLEKQLLGLGEVEEVVEGFAPEVRMSTLTHIYICIHIYAVHTQCIYRRIRTCFCAHIHI